MNPPKLIAYKTEVGFDDSTNKKLFATVLETPIEGTRDFIRKITYPGGSITSTRITKGI